MFALNYLYFFVLHMLLLDFLRKRQQVMRPAFTRQGKEIFSGREAFAIVLISTGVLALAAPAGLDLMALRLLVLEVLCIGALCSGTASSVKNAFVWIYALFLCWVLMGVAYSPVPAYGVRVFLKYLYVLPLCMMCSALVRRDNVAYKACELSRKLSFLAFLWCMVPFVMIVFPGVFWYSTALAINYITMAVLSLCLYWHLGHRKQDLYWAIFFCIPCIIWVFRTSIMGTTLALMTLFFFRYKLKALPVAFGVLVAFICAVFFIPSVKEKMFIDSSGTSVSQLQSGQISFDQINSNGRFAMWEWSLEKFFDPAPLTGSGSGNLQEVFYSLKHPFGTIRICHNDYVQILCDNGLIGIILFVAAGLSLIAHSFVVYQGKRHSAAIRICAATAGAGMAGTMLTLYTDNVINYSMCTIGYPVAFYGMMLGLLKEERRNRRALQQP